MAILEQSLVHWGIDFGASAAFFPVPGD